MVSDHQHHDDALAGDSLARRELDLSYLGRRLRMQKRWLVIPALVGFVASAVAVNLVAPRYTAETKVLIGGQDAFYNRLGATDTQQQPLPDDEAVQSQVQLVSSRDLARQAIKALDLKGNAEFDPLANGLGPVSRILVLLGLERDPLGTPAEERILPNFADRLTVFPVTKSRVLTVEFESKDPDLAARGANTVANLYLAIQSAAKRDSAHAAAESLRTLVADLRARSAEADAKAQAFRSESGLLLGTNNATISSQQLTDMTTQLAQARSAEADAQAKAKLIREMVKAGRLAEVPDVANNDLIRKLSEQHAAVQAEVALQARTLLPGHPRMQELSAQLHDFDEQLRTAAEKVVRGLDSDARIAQVRVENLTAAINTQKDAIGASGGDQVKLSELDLTAKLLKDQLEFNTSKYQEALSRENAGANPADARVISQAIAPQLPSFPKKLPIIAIATIAGFVLSLGLLIAREILSGRAFAEEALPTGLPRPLGTDLSGRVEVDEEEAAFALKPTLDPHEPFTVVDEPAPVPAEAVTVLAEEVAALKQTDLALRILLLSPDDTNAVPDGTALRLGRALSRFARVIHVALHQPGASSAAASPSTERVGFADLLDGAASFAEVIYRDPDSRLHCIATGRDPEAIVADLDGAANVLDALAETYDYVLTSGFTATDPIATLIAADHADVVVLAAAEAIGDAEREQCRADLALDETLPLLTVKLDAPASVYPLQGEAA